LSPPGLRLRRSGHRPVGTTQLSEPGPQGRTPSLFFFFRKSRSRNELNTPPFGTVGTARFPDARAARALEPSRHTAGSVRGPRFKGRPSGKGSPAGPRPCPPPLGPARGSGVARAAIHLGVARGPPNPQLETRILATPAAGARSPTESGDRPGLTVVFAAPAGPVRPGKDAPRAPS